MKLLSLRGWKMDTCLGKANDNINFETKFEPLIKCFDFYENAKQEIVLIYFILVVAINFWDNVMTEWLSGNMCKYLSRFIIFIAMWKCANKEIEIRMEHHEVLERKISLLNLQDYAMQGKDLENKIIKQGWRNLI